MTEMMSSETFETASEKPARVACGAGLGGFSDLLAIVVYHLRGELDASSRLAEHSCNKITRLSASSIIL
jgi:hypothetical protein